MLVLRLRFSSLHIIYSDHNCAEKCGEYGLLPWFCRTACKKVDIFPDAHGNNLYLFDVFNLNLFKCYGITNSFSKFKFFVNTETARYKNFTANGRISILKF